MKPVGQTPHFPLRNNPECQPGPLRNSSIHFCGPISLAFWANASLAARIRHSPPAWKWSLPSPSTYWLAKPHQFLYLEEDFLENGNRSEKPPSLNCSLVKRGKAFLSGDNRSLSQASETCGLDVEWPPQPHGLHFHIGSFLTLVFNPGFHGESFFFSPKPYSASFRKGWQTFSVKGI